MKSTLLNLIVGIVIGMGTMILFNIWTKANKKELEVLPTPFYTVLYENEDIRIVDHNLKPGEIEPMHNHPQMYGYFIEDTDITIIDSDGSKSLKSFSKGQNFLVPPRTHSLINSGTKALHSILVELK